MAARVERTMEEAGVSPSHRERVGRALSLAMGPRMALDDHHVDHLHPGRAVLILLLDTEVRDSGVLAAAALAESERPELRAALPDVAALVGDDVAEWVTAVPLSGDEGLIEALVTADEEVRMAALAERLDHVRHAHLRDDARCARRAYEEVLAAYGPVAERTHPALARRFRAWCRARAPASGR